MSGGAAAFEHRLLLTSRSAGWNSASSTLQKNESWPHPGRILAAESPPTERRDNSIRRQQFYRLRRSVALAFSDKAWFPGQSQAQQHEVRLVGRTRSTTQNILHKSEPAAGLPSVVSYRRHNRFSLVKSGDMHRRNGARTEHAAPMTGAQHRHTPGIGHLCSACECVKRRATFRGNAG